MLYKRGKVWWIRIKWKNQDIRQSSGTSNKSLARRIEFEIQKRLIEDKWFDIDHSKKRTLEEMILRYAEEYTSQRTYYPGKRDHSIFKHLYAFLGKDCPLGEIEQLIGGYEQHRKTRGASPATIVKELGLLRRMYNVARKQWKWKINNPVSEIELPKVRNERVRYLSEAEHKGLFEALEKSEEKWLKPLVINAIDTGLRLSNLCDLRWSEVNLFNRMITIDAEAMKNNDYLGVPLTDRAFLVFKELRKTQCLSGHVFHDNGKKVYDRKVQRALADVLTKAEIKNFHCNDLRHTFASYLRQKGVDLHTISKLLGHKDLRMTNRYAHLSADTLRSAIAKLGGTNRAQNDKVSDAFQS